MKPRNIRHVLITYSLSLNDRTFTPMHLGKIREAAPGAELTLIRDWDEWDRKNQAFGSTVDVAFGRLRPEWVHKLPELRWLQGTSAGTDRLLSNAPEIVASDLILTNTKGTHFAIRLGGRYGRADTRNQRNDR